MPEIIADFDQVTKYVRDVFDISSITMGGTQQRYFATYQGKLIMESEKAHSYLFDHLLPMQLLPAFRWEEDQHLITILSVPTKVSKGNYWLNLVLFVITTLSVLFAGALSSAEMDPFTQPFSLGAFLKFLLNGLPFAVSFLLILTAHEFGHYIMGRHHQVNVSLPYFIPFPLSQLGTMGAFINMKGIPRNRKHLLDIAVAGPLSGLLFAIPILFIGLRLSRLDMIPQQISQGLGFQIEGNSIFYLLAKYITFKEWLPQPATFGGVSPLVYWLRFFFTGRPLPLGGMDVIIHPIAWAGWVGLLVTMLNLIPAGQFDGGHVFYVLFGKKAARFMQPLLLVVLILLGFSWNGWWLWAGLIFLMGGQHAQPLDQITQIDTKRKILAAVVLVIFILIFMPVPLMLVTG